MNKLYFIFLCIFFITSPCVYANQFNVKLFHDNLLNDMLVYAYLGENNKINDIINTYKIKQKPIRGNRQMARRFNDEGLLAVKSGDFGVAVDRFSQASLFDPSDKEISNNLAFAFFENNQFDKGMHELERTINLAIDRPTTWFNLYDALTKRNFETEVSCSALILGLKFSRNISNSYKYLENEISSEANQLIAFNKKKAYDCALSKMNVSQSGNNEFLTDNAGKSVVYGEDKQIIKSSKPGDGNGNFTCKMNDLTKIDITYDDKSHAISHNGDFNTKDKLFSGDFVTYAIDYAVNKKLKIYLNRNDHTVKLVKYTGDSIDETIAGVCEMSTNQEILRQKEIIDKKKAEEEMEKKKKEQLFNL